MDIDLVSIHVPKTAGTSFRHVLQQVYGADAIFHDNGEYADTPFEAIPLEPWHRAIHGHFGVGKYRRNLPDVPRVTWLRHPVDWVISLYGFFNVVEIPDNAIWSYVTSERPSLLEFAADDRVQASTPSRWLKDCSLDDFFFVGVQEHFADDLRELGTMMGWKSVVPPKLNVNSLVLPLREEVWAQPDIFDGIRDRLEKEMTLYDRAIQRRNERRNVCAA